MLDELPDGGTGPARDRFARALLAHLGVDRDLHGAHGTPRLRAESHEHAALLEHLLARLSLRPAPLVVRASRLRLLRRTLVHRFDDAERSVYPYLERSLTPARSRLLALRAHRVFQTALRAKPR